MPTLLHNGVCTRQSEVEASEYEKILDERDKFSERMKGVIRYMADKERKVARYNDQGALMEEIKNLVGMMNARESKTAKIVKLAKVLVWTEMMSLKTYEKALEV